MSPSQIQKYGRIKLRGNSFFLASPLKRLKIGLLLSFFLKIFLGLVFGLSILVGAVACNWKANTQPSVLVILVENLRFGSFSCGDGSDSGRPVGFRTFCEEAVRFTHAYTPSVMSQATIASILTAKYPFEHLVRHNGAQSLSAKEETFAEQAFNRGYRTAFFSGGPPIWKRSGLNQGFEVFEDFTSFGPRSLYRNATEVVKFFKNWLENESPHDRFAAFIYLSDLQFTDVATTNELGEVRESSFHSQLDAIDEALSSLVKDLKRRKLWDSTEVYLVGLQGEPNSGRSTDATAMNLFSESTRATLMVKPTRKQRDGPFNWKIDANVSLVDVGATLFEFIGVPLKRIGSGEALVHSLSAALSGPQPDWSLERPIVSESAWAQWHGLGGVRAAIRRGPYLYIFDEPAVLIDTLTDNLETTSLPQGDGRLKELRSSFSEFLKSVGYSPWKSLNLKIQSKASLSAELWRDRVPSPEAITRLRKLSQHFPDDQQLQGWRALWALRMGDWSELKIAAKGPIGQPTWAYVAARNLNEKAPLPADPCFAIQFGPPWGMPSGMTKSCRLEGLSDLFNWANEFQTEALRTKAMESFMRLYLARLLAAKIAEHSQMQGLTWDTAIGVEGPDRLDLILSLPEFKKLRVLLAAKIDAESGR